MKLLENPNKFYRDIDQVLVEKDYAELCISCKNGNAANCQLTRF